MSDPIDDRVVEALRVAYRDGPEFMALRQAVEDLREDRRKRLSPPPGEAFDLWADSVAREADKTAEVLSAESVRVAKSVKGLMGDVRKAFEKFAKDE
jgi:hypothetical protein